MKYYELAHKYLPEFDIEIMTNEEEDLLAAFYNNLLQVLFLLLFLLFVLK